MMKFEIKLEKLLEKSSEMHIDLMKSFSLAKSNKNVQDRRAERCKLLSEIEKEVGREKLLREIIPLLENRANTLKNQYKLLDNKRIEIKDKPEETSLLKLEGTLGELESFIDWSRMTPEERERTLRISQELAEKGNRIKAFEEKLSPEERKLRQKIQMIIASATTFLPPIGELRVNTPEEAIEELVETNKRLIKGLNELEKELKGDISKCRKLSHKEDLFKFEALQTTFERYKKKQQMLFYFLHIDGKEDWTKKHTEDLNKRIAEIYRAVGE